MAGQGLGHGYPKGLSGDGHHLPDVHRAGWTLVFYVLPLSDQSGQRARKVTPLPKITQPVTEREGQEPDFLVLLLEAPAVFRIPRLALSLR